MWLSQFRNDETAKTLVYVEGCLFFGLGLQPLQVEEQLRNPDHGQDCMRSSLPHELPERSVEISMEYMPIHYLEHA